MWPLVVPGATSRLGLALASLRGRTRYALAEQEPGEDLGVAVGANLPVELRLILVVRVGGDEYQAAVTRLAPALATRTHGGLSVSGRVIDDLFQVLPTVAEKVV